MGEAPKIYDQNDALLVFFHLPRTSGFRREISNSDRQQLALC